MNEAVSLIWPGYGDATTYKHHPCLLYGHVMCSNIKAVKAHWGRKSLMLYHLVRLLYSSPVTCSPLKKRTKWPNSIWAWFTGPKSADLVLHQGLGYVLHPLWAHLILNWKTYLTSFYKCSYPLIRPIRLVLKSADKPAEAILLWKKNTIDSRW